MDTDGDGTIVAYERGTQDDTDGNGIVLAYDRCGEEADGNERVREYQDLSN